MSHLPPPAVRLTKAIPTAIAVACGAAAAIALYLGRSLVPAPYLDVVATPLGAAGHGLAVAVLVSLFGEWAAARAAADNLADVNVLTGWAGAAATRCLRMVAPVDGVAKSVKERTAVYQAYRDELAALLEWRWAGYFATAAALLLPGLTLTLLALGGLPVPLKAPAAHVFAPLGLSTLEAGAAWYLTVAARALWGERLGEWLDVALQVDDQRHREWQATAAADARPRQPAVEAQVSQDPAVGPDEVVEPAPPDDPHQVPAAKGDVLWD